MPSQLKSTFDNSIATFPTGNVKINPVTGVNTQLIFTPDLDEQWYLPDGTPLALNAPTTLNSIDFPGNKLNLLKFNPNEVPEPGQGFPYTFGNFVLS